GGADDHDQPDLEEGPDGEAGVGRGVEDAVDEPDGFADQHADDQPGQVAAGGERDLVGRRHGRVGDAPQEPGREHDGAPDGGEEDREVLADGAGERKPASAARLGAGDEHQDAEEQDRQARRVAPVGQPSQPALDRPDDLVHERGAGPEDAAEEALRRQIPRDDFDDGADEEDGADQAEEDEPDFVEDVPAGAHGQ